MGLRHDASVGPLRVRAGLRPSPRRRTWGFTLIELLLVLVLVGVASAGVGWALRDTEHTRLQREAHRLVALLESARAHSRSSGVPVYWRPEGQGFVFEGMTGDEVWPQTWLHNQALHVQALAPLVLGPEPVIGAQAIVLTPVQSPQIRLRIVTDGLHPFVVEAAP